jgi:hypothetical protein
MAIARGGDHTSEVPDPAADVNGDSREFGPLQVRSGPFS